MKKNRKLTALLVAACMTIPMAATTFTVPMVASAGSITINADTNFKEVTYRAYQIFAVTENTVSNGQGGSETNYTVTGWGNGIDYFNFVSALKNDSLIGNDFTNIQADSGSAKEASDIADIVSKYGNHTDKSNAFARLAGKYTTTEHKEGYDSNGGAVTIENLASGYYVVTENYAPKDKDENYKNTARTLGLLKVVGSGTVTISPKRSYAKVEKFIDNDKKIDDYNIGDDVEFTLKATLPDRLDYYNAYYICFNDTLGTAFNFPSEVKVKAGGSEEFTLKCTDDDTTLEDETTNGNCTVKIEDGKIYVSFENIKAYAVTDNSSVTVTYSAKLNENTKAGNNAFNGSTAQENSVSLTYLSNPNLDWKPDDANNSLETPDDSKPEGTETDLATTPIDKVRVFTYQLDIDKYDGNTNDKLEGAKFKLIASDGKYAVLAGGNGNYTVTGWDADEENGSEFATITDGKVSILGLDAGTYELIETVPPKGYNPLNENKEFTITADLTGTDLTLNKLTIDSQDGQEDTGIVKLGVANNKGTTLPETGGIGTKIFYILGGTLVIGSGAALVIKKRMGKDEE